MTATAQSATRRSSRTILPADGKSHAVIAVPLPAGAGGPVKVRLAASTAPSLILDAFAVLLLPAILVIKLVMGQAIQLSPYLALVLLMVLVIILAAVRLRMGTAGSLDAMAPVRELEVTGTKGEAYVTVYAARHPGVAYLTAPGFSHRIDYKPNSAGQSLFLDWIPTLAYALLFALIVRGFIAASFYIPSGSMENTLFQGDLLIGNKMTYKLLGKDPKRGDIMVFISAPQLNKDPEHRLDFIKRVIGLPGDTVEVKAGVVYINDQPLDEPYIKEEPLTDFPKYKVPEGSFFMMGDNRNNSNDSRYWGCVPRKDLEGRALFVFWPPRHMGKIL
jgi:signal peptidase I